MHATLPVIDETPAAASDDSAIARVLAGARIADGTALIAALEARRTQLGLSNAGLEAAAGLCQGHITKVLGPASKRGPTLRVVDQIMSALGLSFVLVVDPSKVARAEPAWRPRDELHVRTSPLRASTLARAQPDILAAMLRKAVQKKWRGVDAKDFLRAQMGTKP
jgi:DNA-binding phage protein